MPDGAKTLLVILLIPFLCALGHDLYINYFSDDEKIRNVKALRIDPQKFLVSDAGWVWNEYAPNVMSSARDMTAADIWEQKINPVLKLPTMVVSLIPWIITFLYLALARLIGLWPCRDSAIRLSGRGNKKQKFSVYEKDIAKKTKFKR
jgi:hypothetical protein